MINLRIPAKYQLTGELISRMAVWLIIGIGIALRLVLFFQNRNLIIDEANIVRNVQEQGFTGLALPLSYQTYAPPVFLWIEKLISIFWNYGEKAMRLYPLICGIGTLFLFRNLMRRYISDFALLLPMALMSWTYLMIKYSVEVKQYMPDVFISLSLIYFAVTINMLKSSGIRFILFWTVAGTIAIWASMPSVFILSGTGVYYLRTCIKEKKWSYIKLLLLLAVIWLVQFGFYYWYILKAQIGSSYLQNFHNEYFLFLIPHNAEQWQHNQMRLKEIINNTGGYDPKSQYMTMGLMIIGLLAMIRKNFSLFLLIFVPVILTLAAAALHQFTLIDRVILYLLPLNIILAGYGINELTMKRFFLFPALILAAGIYMMNNFNQFKLFREHYGLHEMTENFGYLMEHHARGDQMYVHDGCPASYAYYTEVHPDKEKWARLKGAHILDWRDNYVDVTSHITDTAYFVYTGGFPDEERIRRTSEIEKNMQQVGYFEKYISHVYMYVPKKH